MELPFHIMTFFDLEKGHLSYAKSLGRSILILLIKLLYCIRKHLPQMHILPQVVVCAVGVFLDFTC